ncbi:MAG: hypothetical protein KGZ85_07800 [Ignavibacterium sp.]|nr:hypothetical protein [Ignavibacterium sp.]
MIAFEWLFFIIVVIVAAYYHYWKKPIFDKHKAYFEIVIISFTVAFAIYQVRTSAEDFNNIIDRMGKILKSAQESKESLKEVEKSISDLPDKIDAFSKSIDSFTSNVISQRDQFESVLSSFNHSLIKFQLALDSLTSRLNRKPELNIDAHIVENDSMATITKIIISNRGNIKAELSTLRFQIPEAHLINFNFKGSRETPKQGNNQSFQRDFREQPIYPSKYGDKPIVLESDIQLKNNGKFTLYIIVYYDSPFGNDGYESKSITFSPRKK